MGSSFLKETIYIVIGFFWLGLRVVVLLCVHTFSEFSVNRWTGFLLSMTSTTSQKNDVDTSFNKWNKKKYRNDDHTGTSSLVTTLVWYHQIIVKCSAPFGFAVEYVHPDFGDRSHCWSYPSRHLYSWSPHFHCLYLDYLEIVSSCWRASTAHRGYDGFIGSISWTRDQW